MGEKDERGVARRVATWALRVGAWAALAGVAAVFAARQWGWESGFSAYLVAMIPWLAAAVVVLLIVALFARWWVEAGAAAVLAAIAAAWVGPLFTAAPHDGDPVMTVATVNMRFGEADPQQIVDLVAEHGVDLLSVQELTPSAEAALREAGLDRYMQYSETHAGAAAVGTGLWSRYELHDAGLVVSLDFNTVRATVQAPGGEVTVFAAHPPPPVPGHHERWRQQIDGLREVSAATPGAVLIAGDINATVDHWPLRDILADGFVDAADQAGAGFLPTFPQERFAVALVPIDHVLTRDTDLVATSVSTYAIEGADHRAVVADFALAPGSAGS